MTYLSRIQTQIWRQVIDQEQILKGASSETTSLIIEGNLTARVLSTLISIISWLIYVSFLYFFHLLVNEWTNHESLMVHL